eukprot:COSAG06_NODE_60799_length_269_cov_1.800000_1_plen_44_part_10
MRQNRFWISIKGRPTCRPCRAIVKGAARLDREVVTLSLVVGEEV